MKTEEAIRKKPELRVIIGGRTAEVIIREFAAALDPALAPQSGEATSLKNAAEAQPPARRNTNR